MANRPGEFEEIKTEADAAYQRARRLEMIVYAALTAFVVLAIYGFWLITSLTRDVSQLTEEISEMTRVVDRDMSTIAGYMEHMSNMDAQMVRINETMLAMNENVASIAVDTASIDGSVVSMTHDAEAMAAAAVGLQQDMWSLNRNVGAPMGIMNTFNPFSGQTGPFPGSPGPYHPRGGR